MRNKLIALAIIIGTITLEGIFLYIPIYKFMLFKMSTLSQIALVVYIVLVENNKE